MHPYTMKKLWAPYPSIHVTLLFASQFSDSQTSETTRSEVAVGYFLLPFQNRGQVGPQQQPPTPSIYLISPGGLQRELIRRGDFLDHINSDYCCLWENPHTFSLLINTVIYDKFPMWDGVEEALMDSKGHKRVCTFCRKLNFFSHHFNWKLQKEINQKDVNISQKLFREKSTWLCDIFKYLQVSDKVVWKSENPRTQSRCKHTQWFVGPPTEDPKSCFPSPLNWLPFVLILVCFLKNARNKAVEFSWCTVFHVFQAYCSVLFTDILCISLWFIRLLET